MLGGIFSTVVVLMNKILECSVNYSSDFPLFKCKEILYKDGSTNLNLILPFALIDASLAISVSPFIFMSAPILVGTVTLFAWESGNNLILVMKRGIAFLKRNGLHQ